MASERAARSWAASARDLYLVAMAVFVVNIAIGILNGADAVDFDHNQWEAWKNPDPDAEALAV